MTNCLTWAEIITELPDVILVAFCLGGIVGGVFGLRWRWK